MKLVVNGSYNRPIACLGWTQAFAKEFSMYNPNGFAIKDLHEPQQQILDTRLAVVVTHDEQARKPVICRCCSALTKVRVALCTVTSPGPIRNGRHYRTVPKRWSFLPVPTLTSARGFIRARPSTAKSCRPGTTSLYTLTAPQRFSAMPTACSTWSVRWTDRHEAGRDQPWKSRCTRRLHRRHAQGHRRVCPADPAPGRQTQTQSETAAPDIAGVREGLAASPDVHDQALAHLMR